MRQANDMIDRGSDHRAVEAQFRFPGTKKSDSQTENNGVQRTYGRVVAVITKLTTLKNEWNRTHCSEKDVRSWKKAHKEARSSSTTKRGKDGRRLERSTPRECFRSGSGDA